MDTFYFVVRVDVEDDDKAEEVMNKVFGHTTDLEFPHEISWVWQDYPSKD